MSSDALTSALVIIPTYNERENLPTLIDTLLTAAPSVDVLVVDDNSPDGTGDIADLLAESSNGRMHVLHRDQKNGIGPAYRAGFSYALTHDYAIVVTMDADFSHDPTDVPRLLLAASRYDVAVGSRYVSGGRTVGWPLFRRLISRTGGNYAKRVLGVPIEDPTSGFKAYRRSVIASFDQGRMRSDGYSFQIETVYRALKRGFSVTEIPIVFHDRTKGRSKLSRRIVLETITVVWRLRFERD